MSIDFPPDPRGRELMLILERAKYERFIFGQVDALLAEAFNAVLDLMHSRQFRELTVAQRRRALQLYRELDRRITAGYVDVTAFHVKEMKLYAAVEAQVARATVLSVAGDSLEVSLGPFLPKAFVESIAKLPIQGLNIGEWFETQATTMSRETRRIIQMGLIEGKGPSAIASRIVADARSAGPVLSRRALSEAKIISRTTVNAVQNEAAMASYEMLPESVSDSYRLLVVRDARTTVICSALADKVYRYDDPKRRVPPFHVGCRTGCAPVVKGADLTLTAQRSGPMGFRSYDAWLKSESVTTQNTMLGATRAGLWRDGKMSLADAVDADNRVLTLPELRAKLGL